MIKSTDAYKAAVTGDSRRVRLHIAVDVSDPNKEYTTPESNDQSKYSNPSQLHNRKMEIKKYATLEQNRFRLDGSYPLFPDTRPDDVELGYLSDSVSGTDGTFAVKPFIEAKFTGVAILQAASVHFSKNPDDGVPEDFTVSIYEGGVERHKQDFTGNDKTSVFLKPFTVYGPTGIRVTVSKTSKPFRRVRVPEITLGLFEEWTESDLSEFSLKQQGDISCVTLPFGTCMLRMDNLDRRFEPRKKDSVFQSITERQKVEISMGIELPDGKIEYKKVGDYFQKSDGWKTSDNDITMQWNLTDIVGMLSDRIFNVPDALPTTLEGWAQELSGQLGKPFRKAHKVDPAYKDKPLTVSNKAQLFGLTCGDVIRFVAQASGTWPRADNQTGYLTFEPLWQEGNKITLDNLEQYPTMRANKDVSVIFFSLFGEDAPFTVSGNSVSAADTISITNPFIHSREEAMKVARNILAAYGGNQIEITGRGDMASEIGDVDTIWLDESSATTARRMIQNFNFQSGVLKGAVSTLLQADGVKVYEGRTVITQSGNWTAPAGKTKLRIILVGKGEDGTDGTNGSTFRDGEPGTDGFGARIWADTISINDKQTFSVSIGKDTTFGVYSSANGKLFQYGYTDVNSGNSYGRTGVKNPTPGSGDGGAGGEAGLKEEWHKDEEGYVVTDREPTPGGKGATGASGCVVVYWEK